MDRSGEGLGVSRQREDGQALIERKGWTLAEEYVDNDVSASTGKVRPAYQRMLADVRSGSLDAVVVWDIDRLTRRPIEVEEFIELADDHRIALASVGGDVDIATDNGRMYLRIKGAVARGEVDAKARRQRRQRQQAAEQGRQSGGPRAFGYTADGLHLDASEAPLLVEAYRQFLAGSTLGSTARWLTEQGTTTPRGKAWRYQSVRTVLANPRNAGIRGVRHQLPGKAGRNGARETWHTEVGPAQWPAVVDREVWDAVMSILKDPRRGERHVGNRQRYLLSGIATCATCGAKLVTGRRDGARLLRCPSLAHVSRKAEPIEEFVLEVLMAKMADPAVSEALRRPSASAVDLVDLRTRSLALQARKDEATAMWTDGLLDASSMRFAHKRADEQLAEIDDQLAQAVRHDRTTEMVGAGDPRVVWESWPLETQRQVLARRLDVTVLPGRPGRPGGRRFDPSTVRVTWRA